MPGFKRGGATVVLGGTAMVALLTAVAAGHYAWHFYEQLAELKLAPTYEDRYAVENAKLSEAEANARRHVRRLTDCTLDSAAGSCGLRVCVARNRRRDQQPDGAALHGGHTRHRRITRRYTSRD